MIKHLITFILLCACTVVQANTPTNTDTHRWAGYYVGLTTGGAWGAANPISSTVADGYISATDAASINATGNQSIHMSGFITGLQGGYNWIFNQTFIGLEADVATLELGDSIYSAAISYPSSPSTTYMTGAYVNINWLATLRPRVGFRYKNSLIYLTGGPGITRLHSNYYFDDSNGANASGSTNKIVAGYVLGAGTEVGLTQNWSMKLEYLFGSFNRTNATHTGSDLLVTYPNQVFTHSTNLNVNQLRLGLNYKID